VPRVVVVVDSRRLPHQHDKRGLDTQNDTFPMKFPENREVDCRTTRSSRIITRWFLAHRGNYECKQFVDLQSEKGDQRQTGRGRISPETTARKITTMTLNEMSLLDDGERESTHQTWTENPYIRSPPPHRKTHNISFHFPHSLDTPPTPKHNNYNEFVLLQ